MSKIKKLISTAGMCLALATGNAQVGSVELFGGNKYSVSDVKVLGDITPKIKFFGRTRIAGNYETGKPSLFSLVDCNYSLGKGLSFAVQGQAFGDKIEYQTGLEYFNKGKNWKGFASLKGNHKYLETLDWIEYGLSLNENLSARFYLEGIAQFGFKGQNKIFIRPRVGLKIKNKYSFGPSAEINIFGQDVKQNYGLFGKIDF